MKSKSQASSTKISGNPPSSSSNNRERTEESLQEYQTILATAEEVAKIGSWKWDLRNQKITWSDEMFRLFGVEREGFDGDMNRLFAERIHPEDAGLVAESNRSILEDARPVPLSYRIVLPDGTERTVWAQGKLLRDEKGQPYALTGYVQDITERVKADKKIVQLKRLYATLSQVNQMIVRVKERQELFQTICDVAVKFGEFSVSWIGLLNENTGDIQPVASHGPDINNWPLPIINIYGGKYQNEVIKEAITACRVVTSDDVLSDERTKSLREIIRKFGFRSLACIPFCSQGKTIGVLNLISSEPGSFKAEEEIRLLEEMGIDISFALDTMENEQQRRRAEEALSESENKYRSLVETSPDGIFINRQNRIVFVNQRAVEMLGANKPEQLLGRSPFEIFHPDSHSLIKQRIKTLLEDRQSVPAAEESIMTLDGRIIPVDVTATPVTVDGAISIQVVLRDITDRKRAEEALRLSERNFSKAFNSTPAALLITRISDGKYMGLNEAYCEIVGYARDELIGHCTSDFNIFIEPGDRQKIVNQLLANGSIRDFETSIRNRSGEIRHVIASQELITFGGEECILSSFIDITLRKQSELLLRENEERLRLSLQAANQGLYDLNIQTGDAVVNQEYAEMLGHDYETFVETNADWIDRLHPDDRESVGKAYSDYVNGLLPEYRVEFRQQTKDEKWIWILSLGKVIEYDAEGRPLRMLGTHTDITERKQMEEALRRNEHVLRLFVEHSPASIAMFDRDMKYIVTSRRYLIDYRLGEQNLIGRSHYEIFPEIPERWKEIHRRCQQGAIEIAEEDPFPREDGSLDWVRWEIRPWYEETGSIGGIILFSEVITERKRAQDELRILNLELEQRVLERTMELTQANRAKDEFLANMSHELRTPLNTVLGLSETLLEQQRGPLNEKQTQCLELIASSGRHLLGLINDILDVSKIEAGRLQLHLDQVFVKDVCESSLNFIKELALKKLIHVEFRNASSISSFYADPQRLKQILINLLTNAVKFTPERGGVTLNVSTDEDMDQILFSISDTGIGIARDDLKKLFTPFTQLDSSLSRQYTGTGLGLALVEKLTDLHGGSVQVESEFGKGSRFVITLPLHLHNLELVAGEDKAKERPGKQNATLQMPSLKERTILLAEDNQVNSHMMVEYLEAQGYKVLTAMDGEEVLTITAEMTPDIILMDIQMPKMDGLEATRQLRMDSRFSSTPIIALTALAMPGDKERCLEAGVNEYLSKPVSLKMLVKVMEGLMAGGR